MEYMTAKESVKEKEIILFLRHLKNVGIFFGGHM